MSGLPLYLSPNGDKLKVPINLHIKTINKMIVEIAEFKAGVYTKRCELYNNISIGSVLCIGHSVLNLKPCKYCCSFKENNTYYLPLLQENIKIVSEVSCNRPKQQLNLF